MVLCVLFGSISVLFGFCVLLDIPSFILLLLLPFIFLLPHSAMLQYSSTLLLLFSLNSYCFYLALHFSIYLFAHCTRKPICSKYLSWFPRFFLCSFLHAYLLIYAHYLHISFSWWMVREEENECCM
jgi:hypothetical protein